MNELEKEEITFEKAFQRLDELLKKLNSSDTPLEEALHCYEEADKLITLCNARLSSAERRIETLIKNRQGDVAVDDKGIPCREPFAPRSS